MTNNYVYEFGDSLYLNITNRCPNNCEFCIRNIKDGVSGSDLWLLKEPTFEELVDDISMYDLSKYKEIVFCGFGERMCNLSMISQIAPYLKKKGCKIRINTNGLGNLINKHWGEYYSGLWYENILNVSKVSYDKKTGVATPTFSYLGYKPSVSDVSSRWHMQLGVRLTF